MTRVRPLRDVRTRLLLIVVVALALALGAATIGFNILLARSTSRDANAFLRARAAAELSMISVVHGRLRVAEPTDDTLGSSRVWIFRGTQPIEAPKVHVETASAAQSLAGGRLGCSTSVTPTPDSTPCRSSRVANGSAHSSLA